MGETSFNARLTAAATFLAAITALAYSNSLHAPFIFDDLGNILQNPTVAAGFPWTGALCPPSGIGIAGRPLINLSLAINHSISGFDPASYHALNLVIHIGAALFLFGLARLGFKDMGMKGAPGPKADAMAFFSALVFALHPLQTQAVTYVIQRCESLMGFLFLGCLYFAARGFSSGKKTQWHAAAMAFFLMGIGVKEVIAAAPFLIFLYEAVILRKKAGRALRESACLYAGLSMGLFVLAFLIFYGGRAGVNARDQLYTPWQYFVTEPWVLARYLRLAVFPRGLCMDYGLKALPLSVTWPYAALMALFLGAAVLAVFKRRPAGFIGAWFFLVLAPTSSFLPVPELIFEYRMYLPLAGLAVLAVVSANSFLARLGLGGKPAMALGAAAALLLGGLTFDRNRDYSSAVTIWADTVQKAPENPRALTNLGESLTGEGRNREAAAVFQRSLKIRPDHLQTRMDLVAALAEADDGAGAEKALSEAARLFGNEPEIFQARGELALRGGRYDEALKAFSKALSARPAYPEARFGLGTALAATGRLPDAERELREALRLRPSYPEAAGNLGWVLLNTGRPFEAAEVLKRAFKLRPGDAIIRKNLDQALSVMGQTAR